MTTTVYHNSTWLSENKLQPYTEQDSFISIYCSASGSAPAVLVVAVWYDYVWLARFFDCVVVEESSPRFNADAMGHITTGLAASLDTRKHENR